jgi:dethiobiotin synthetase
MKGLFVTATDTNVGKTWVGKHLIHELIIKGYDAVPRKPVESGWNTDITQTDAWTLAMAANMTDSLDIVCQNRFKAAISPDRAAFLEHKNITIEQLRRQCLNQANKNDFLYVEGAGGFYSPLCSDGLNADLAVSLGLPVLLVVENRLGCINQTLLTVEAIENRELKLIAIVLNSPRKEIQDREMDNFVDLQKHTNYPVLKFNHNDQLMASMDNLCSLAINH